MAAFVAAPVEKVPAYNGPRRENSGTLWIPDGWMSMKLPLSNRARWLVAAMFLSGLTWTGLITAVSMMVDGEADQLSTASTR